VRGHIQRRGRSSWRLKFDVAENGSRQTRYITVHGTKRDAQIKLAGLISSIGKGQFVEPNKMTVGEFVRTRVAQWEASGNISARTAQRYRQLVEHQIMPFIGARVLQQLRPLDVENWHATLRTSGRVRGKGNLAARTVRHAHKVLGKALADAASNELVHRNVARLKPLKMADTADEMIIVRDVAAMLEKLKGSVVHVPALLGLLCGMRLGEVLALRWSRIDWAAKVIQIREAMEETKVHGIRFKAAKTRAGRRDITMPDEVIEALRTYRRDQLELRLQLGIGRLQDEALLFTTTEGEPRSLSSMSRAWSDFPERIGMPDVTFHGLRHSHASQLIDAGVDIVTISKRLGHAKPDITLRIYAHLFQKDDSKAAAAINAALQR
jgi:integrase